MDYKDYYKILGIDKKATQTEVKKAYRALAIKYHPDKNPGSKEAEDKFKLVNEANTVLNNTEKRKKYDELGENWQQYEQTGNQKNGRSTGGRRQPQYDEGFGGGGQSDFSDFFEQFFSGKRGTGQTQGRGFNNPSDFKGGDYETEMEITLEEAYAGTSRIIQLENEKLRITTKPGSYDDQLLSIKGKGAKGSSKEFNGNLFVRIKVKQHPDFIRKGDNLSLIQKIDLYTAVLGGEMIIKTLSGQVKINIPEGTQNGKIIRLKGKGMPVYEYADKFGDLNIQIQVLIPSNLTEQQRELFGKLKSDL